MKQITISKAHASTHNTESRRGTSIKYVVIHYTAGLKPHAGKGADVCDMFANPKSRCASADFVVDEGNIAWQYNPNLDTRACWHCGGSLQGSKGHSFYGKCTNYNSIGIEMCSGKDKVVYKNGVAQLWSSDRDWFISDETWKSAVALSVYLLKKYKLGIDRLIRHFDVTGKECPSFFVDGRKMTHYDNQLGQNLWKKFKNDVAKELKQKVASTTITKSSAKTTKPKAIDVYYAVMVEGGKTYPEVKNCEDYAGVKGKAITGIKIRVPGYKIKYRVHVKDGNWLPYVSGCSWSDTNNGYAGNGKAIDAMSAVLDGKHEIVYRLANIGKDYCGWQWDENRDNGLIGCTKTAGKKVDRLQVRIKVK